MIGGVIIVILLMLGIAAFVAIRPKDFFVSVSQPVVSKSQDNPLELRRSLLIIGPSVNFPPCVEQRKLIKPIMSGLLKGGHQFVEIYGSRPATQNGMPLTWLDGELFRSTFDAEDGFHMLYVDDQGRIKCRFTAPVIGDALLMIIDPIGGVPVLAPAFETPQVAADRLHPTEFDPDNPPPPAPMGSGQEDLPPIILDVDLPKPEGDAAASEPTPEEMAAMMEDVQSLAPGEMGGMQPYEPEDPTLPSDEDLDAEEGLATEDDNVSSEYGSDDSDETSEKDSGKKRPTPRSPSVFKDPPKETRQLPLKTGTMRPIGVYGVSPSQTGLRPPSPGMMTSIASIHSRHAEGRTLKGPRKRFQQNPFSVRVAGLYNENGRINGHDKDNEQLAGDMKKNLTKTKEEKLETISLKKPLPIKTVPKGRISFQNITILGE